MWIVSTTCERDTCFSAFEAYSEAYKYMENDYLRMCREDEVELDEDMMYLTYVIDGDSCWIKALEAHFTYRDIACDWQLWEFKIPEGWE